jgi:hypothetical protein
LIFPSEDCERLSAEEARALARFVDDMQEDANHVADLLEQRRQTKTIGLARSVVDGLRKLRHELAEQACRNETAEARHR